MKKFISLLIFFLVILFFHLKNSLADVILPGTKIVNRCVRIDNLSLFPDISLLVLERRVIENSDKVYEIINNKCLTREYKGNALKIYWNFKGELKIEEDKILIDNVDFFYKETEENNPLVNEEIVYSLTKDSQGRIRLYKSKEIKKYSDGQIKTIDFESPFKMTVLPTLSKKNYQQAIKTTIPTKTTDNSKKTVFYNNNERNFLATFLCWLKKFFGVSCL